MSARARTIAVDVRMMHHSGIGTYVRNLVPRVIAARPDWQFVLLGSPVLAADAGWPPFDNATWRVVNSPVFGVAEQVELALRAPRGADLFWTPHYNIPLSWGGKLLVTIHDAYHVLYPHLVNGSLKRAYARIMFGAVKRRAHAVLCDSEFTGNELLRAVGEVRSGPYVVHLGVDPGWFLAAPIPSDRPYVVYVGNIKPHKNVIALVDAFARIVDRVPHDLVIVGRPDPGVPAAARLGPAAAGLMERGRLRLTGTVPFDVVQGTVSGADALVTTTLYEGFGFPPLEAMAAGCPCLVSRVASLPEVCGDAVLYCDPRDVGDIAARLTQLLTDRALHALMRERGRARARQFTWDRCTAETLQVMEGVLVT